LRITGLIVDDEPLARAHLLRLLKAQEVEILAEADNAATGLQLAEDLHPDIVFLDIQMPGLTGMQMAAAMMHLDMPPLIVFVTGYSEYALDAFDRNAMDYLVKPLSPDRLAQTLVRARERLANRAVRNIPSGTAGADTMAAGAGENRTDAPGTPAVSAAEQADLKPETPTTLRRLPIRENYAVRLLRIEEILCAVSREKRVFVRTAGGEYRTYYTLTQLETLLPPDLFLRIHDSCLVQLERVEEIIFLGNHTYRVRLSDGELLPVGRSRYPELQRRLGLEADVE
jgi:DNA-binding LytR/AlgR family response regulator